MAVAQALTTDLQNQTAGRADRSVWHQHLQDRNQVLDGRGQEHPDPGLQRAAAVEPAHLAGRGSSGIRLRLLALQLRRKKHEAEKEAQAEETAFRLPRPRSRRPTRQFGPAAQWAQFWGSAKLEFRRLIKTIPFVVITAAALLNCLTALIFNSTEAYRKYFVPGHLSDAGVDRGNAVPLFDRTDHVSRRSADLGGARQQQ